VTTSERFYKVKGSVPDGGLSYKGVVTAIPGVDQFTIASLAGMGVGKFAGATNPYTAFVMRDAGGLSAAPQGEKNPVTAYDSVTGTFTSPGFSVPIDVGDEIIILSSVIGGIGGGGSGATIVNSASISADWNSSGPAIVCTLGAAGVQYRVHSLIIDISALGGNVTPIMLMSVNGIQKQIFPPKTGTTFKVSDGDSPGIALINGTFCIANPLEIRVSSDLPGDDGTSIGYEYFLEAI
jgi:hypothetical protein